MKIQKISEIQAILPMTEFDFLKKYKESFAMSELGRIHSQLPLKEIADWTDSGTHMIERYLQ